MKMSTSARRKISLLTLIASLNLLGACSWMDPFHWFTSKECVDRSSDYLHVEEHPLLAMPPGADAPDRHNLLVVPDAQHNEIKGKCLDKPPRYFGYSGRIAASPEETVADWAQAWADRNADGVIAMYSSQYGTEGTVTPLAQRHVEIETGPTPEGRIKNLKVSAIDNNRRLAKFTQTFGSTDVVKEITLIRESGVWKIIDEKVITTK